jgi:hypothetical protein
VLLMSTITALLVREDSRRGISCESTAETNLEALAVDSSTHAHASSMMKHAQGQITSAHIPARREPRFLHTQEGSTPH